jgi:hypothetical protein
MLSGLASARLKLIRATEHLDTVKSCCAAYTNRSSHEIVTHSDSKKTVHATEIPSPEISIYAGEVVYQIRSALDHLAFHLVNLNSAKIRLPKNWHEKCEFPLWLRRPESTAFNCFNRILPGITVNSFTFVESVQPYQGRGIGNALKLLAILSNIDKHRHLNLTSARISLEQSIEIRPGQGHVLLNTMRDGAEVELAPGGDMASAMKVESHFSTFVTFDERILGVGPHTLPVERLLEVCLYSVKGTIVPAFEKFLQNP